MSELLRRGIRAATRRLSRRGRQVTLLWGIVAVLPQARGGPTRGPSSGAANDAAPRTGRSPGHPTRILVLYALAPESPTSAVFLARLRTTLRTELATPVEFFEEFVDLDRFSAEGWKYFTRFYAQKYRDRPPDLIVAVGLVAMDFAVDRLRSIMPGVPIVFGMVYAHRVNPTALPANVTGRTIRMTLGRSLAMAIRLQPRAERVVVIAGASRVDSIAMSDALADLAGARQSIRVDRWQAFPYDSLLRALRRLTPSTIVYFAYFRRDGRGRTMVPMEILPEITGASGAPVYGYADAMIGTGVAGGAMWRHDNEAVQTARLAARVLRAPGGTVFPGVEDAPTPYMADWRALRRFGLDERRLMPGAVVLHREPDLWDRYRRMVFIAVGVVLLEACLIGLLLAERRRRLRVQSAMAEQTRFERMIADLTTDAARYAPQAMPRALEAALGRLGRFAGAEEVVLTQYCAPSPRPSTSVHWRSHGSGRIAETRATNGTPAGTGPSLELPLVVADLKVGMLRLSRARGADPWPSGFAERLVAAADVLAAAIAQAAATQRAEDSARQIAHIGRVAMIGELASTISHELRQPLAAILINGEVGKRLLARREDARKVDRIMDDIIADTRRANEMIEHIRSLLRKEAPPQAIVDVNLICAEAADLLRYDAFARGIRLEVRADALVPLVPGQPIELEQVALNLLLNAFDAVMSGPERSVVISTAALPEGVQIAVSDSGPGLSPDALSHLFESFFTTKVHGLGMGLTIVQSIVQRHQGRIQVERGEHGGAVFRVILPHMPPVADADRRSPAPCARTGATGRRGGRTYTA